MSTQAEKIAEALESPAKVALYMAMEYGGFTIGQVRYVDYDKHYQPLPEGQQRELPYLDGYVRVSEPVEISFSQTSPKDIVARAVESLEETERKLLVETEARLAKLREQKNQLLAIAHQPEAGL